MAIPVWGTAAPGERVTIITGMGIPIGAAGDRLDETEICFRILYFARPIP